MNDKETQKNWQNYMFLLNCREDSYRNERNEFFRNGSWFIHKSGLKHIKARMVKPKMEKPAVKVSAPTGNVVHLEDTGVVRRKLEKRK